MRLEAAHCVERSHFGLIKQDAAILENEHSIRTDKLHHTDMTDKSALEDFLVASKTSYQKHGIAQWIPITKLPRFYESG